MGPEGHSRGFSAERQSAIPSVSVGLETRQSSAETLEKLPIIVASNPSGPLL
jgi:predicted dienelactone hydrolase